MAANEPWRGMGVVRRGIEVPVPPPSVLTLVGTPLTALNIPYFGDFDLTTEHMILGDVGNARAYIIDCTTINPSILGSVFEPGGYYQAIWGVNNVNTSALYFANTSPGPGGINFDGLFPLDTTSHSAPSGGTRVDLVDPSMMIRHGSRLLVSTFAGDLRRYTLSGTSVPTATGSPLASASGRGCGHPNDPDVIFVCRGTTLLSIDISGASPTVIQTFTPGGSFNTGYCQAVDNTLYITALDSFHMVDITNPASMSVLGSYVFTGTFAGAGGGTGLTVEPNGMYAYSTNGGAAGFHIVACMDCRNPAAISILCYIFYLAVGVINNPMDIFYDSVVGDRLFLITQVPSVRAISITR